MNRLLLATDIGTTSVRSMVYDRTGRVYSRAQRLYPTLHPASHYEEQDPLRIKRDVFAAIRECVVSFAKEYGSTEQIQALAFSSQMYSILAVDKDGNPLIGSILWSDGRSEKEVNQIAQQAGPLGWYEVTGCPPSSMFPIAKIRWIQNAHPELLSTIARYISIKEFVISDLIEEPVVDYSMASATGLFDIRNHYWSQDALKSAGITSQELSRPVSGLEVFEIDNRQLVAELGLSPDVKLILAGGDGPLANIGSGAYEIGAVNIDLGTSGAARVLTNRAVTDTTGSLWCFCLTEKLWTYGGILSNVGNAFDWIAGSLLDQDPLQTELKNVSGCRRLSCLAASVPAGSDGLIIQPYLRRARSPSWDTGLSGSILGLNASHTLAHITRALIEAIGYDLKTILNLMADRVDLLPKIILSGGIARGENIAQILASILNTPLVTVQHTEASLSGAAIMGLYALGEVEKLRFDRDECPQEHTIDVNWMDVEIYQKSYKHYQKLLEQVPRVAITGELNR